MRRLRRFAKLLFTIIIPLIASLLVAFFFLQIAPDIARSQLDKQLNTFIPGNYSLHYDQLYFDWSNKALIGEDLVFFPDAISESANNQKVVQLYIPGFRIKLKALLPLFLERKLLLAGIQIDKPEIIISDKSQEKTPNISGTSISLLQGITTYLNLLKIDSFRISSGSLNYNLGLLEKNEQLILENIQFLVKQFSIDSTLSKHRFLNAEAIDLIITNQHLKLPDGTHELTFEKFHLSSLDSTLQFTNLSLKANPTLPSTTKPWQLSNDPLYDITIPRLMFKGIDYNTSYLDNNLQIREAILDGASVNIEQKSVKGENLFPLLPSPKTDALFEIIANLAPQVSIQNISFRKGIINLDIEFPFIIQSTWEIDHLTLENFSVNTQNYGFLKNQLPFENFEGTITNYQQNWPDGIHSVIMDTLYFNSSERKIIAGGIQIKPKFDNKEPTESLLNQKVAYLEVKGINLTKILLEEEIYCTQIKLTNPQTHLISPLTATDNLKQSNPLELIRMAAANFLQNNLFAKNVTIENGFFSLNNQLILHNYNILTTNLKVSPNLKSWRQMLPEFFISIDSLSFRRDSQYVSLGFFGSDGKNHTCMDLYANLKTKYVNSLLKTKKLLILNSPLDSLLSGTGNADSSFIRHASLSIYYKKEIDGSNRQLSPIPIPAKFLQTEDFQIELRGVNQLFKIQHLYSKWNFDNSFPLLEMQANNLSINQLNNNLDLFAGSINAQRNIDKLIIGDGLIQLNTPGINHLNIAIPQSTITFNDIDSFFKNDAMNIRSIVFQNPSIVLKKINTPNTSSQAFPSLPTPNACFLDSLTIQNGNFHFIDSLIENSITSIKCESFDLQVGNIDFCSNPLQQDFWKELSYHWSSDSTFVYQNKHLYIDIPKSFGNNLERTWTLQKPNLFLRVNNYLSSVDFNLIELKGLSLPALFERKEIQAKELNMQANNIFLKKQVPLLLISDSPNDDFSIVYPPTKIEKITLKLHKFETNLDSLLMINNVHADILHFEADTSLDIALPETYFDSATFSINKLSRTFGSQNEYSYSTSVNWDFPANKLSLNNNKIEPLYSKEEYAKIFPFRKDYISLSIDSLQLYGCAAEWIKKQHIKSPLMEVKGMKLSISRDERLPQKIIRKELIQEQIKSIPFPLTIEEGIVFADVFYESMPSSSHRSAVINLTNIKAGLSNLSNLEEHFSSNFNLAATGNMYAQNTFELKTSFSMNDTLNSFTLNGMIKNLNLRSLNKVITPLTKIRIQKGKSKSIQFDISANNDYAIGEMIFKYNNLKINMLDKRNTEQMGFGNSIRSFWINQIVKTNNPTLLKPRKGIIYYKRDTSRETLNFIVHAILSGMVSSTGIKNNKRQLKKMGTNELKSLNYEEIFGDLLKIGKEEKDKEKSNPH